MIVMAPVVLSVSFPMKSQPIKLMELPGNPTSAVNFWLSLFGIDFRVSTHSLRMRPPELTAKIQSISLEISNS